MSIKEKIITLLKANGSPIILSTSQSNEKSESDKKNKRRIPKKATEKKLLRNIRNSIEDPCIFIHIKEK